MLFVDQGQIFHVTVRGLKKVCSGHCEASAGMDISFLSKIGFLENLDTVTKF